MKRRIQRQHYMRIQSKIRIIFLFVQCMDIIKPYILVFQRDKRWHIYYYTVYIKPLFMKTTLLLWVILLLMMLSWVKPETHFYSSTVITSSF